MIYKVLREERLWPPAGGRPTSSRGSGRGAVEILSEDLLLDLLPREGLGLIIGPQGVGKSATAHRLAELSRGRRPVAVIGPEDLRAYLPRSVRLVPSLQDVPAGAIAVFDEAHVAVSARATMTAINRDIVHLVGFLRQRGILLLTVAHHASDLDRRLTQHSSAILIKKLSIFVGMDRAALRGILARAVRAFAKASGDPHRLVYAVVGDQEVLAENSLPSYWSEQLSRAYASWSPTQRARDEEPPEAQEQNERETRRRIEEEGEQAKLLRVQRQREQLAEQWYYLLLDQAIPLPLAHAVRVKALTGWTGARLKRLQPLLPALLASHVDVQGLTTFLTGRSDALVIGELRSLRGALGILTRWKIPPETVKEFLALFWQRPQEALGALAAAGDADPTWRSWRLRDDVVRRLAALAEQARVEAIREGIAHVLTHLFHRRGLRPAPEKPSPPGREFLVVTTPTGPVEAEVLARRDGQRLVQLPGGRLLSISDPTNRGPPAPRAE